MTDRIDLHIDELVLHGVPHADAAAVGGALRAELARLLSAGASVAGGGDLAVRERSVTADLAGATTPAALGSRVAGAVHKQLGGGR